MRPIAAWTDRHEFHLDGSARVDKAERRSRTWLLDWGIQRAIRGGSRNDPRLAIGGVGSGLAVIRGATRQRHGEHHDRDQTQEGRNNRRLVRFDRSAHDLWVPKNCTQPARKLGTRGEDSQILADQLGQGSTRKMPHIPFWSWPADMLR